MMKRFSIVLLAAVMFGAAASAQQRQVPANQAEVQLSFAPIVKRVGPAVVNVYATRTVQQRRGSPFFDDPFFRRFFGDRLRGRPQQRMQSSLGSGVIIDASGTVVTNHHVIKGADEVKIALSDKREFEADIILKDERTDLAILKVREPRGAFPFVEFQASDSLEVGDLVLAIGNPFGVGQTVTQGIISALARTRVGVTDFQFFIQTDAAINPGNSGGALIDMQGRLVGINTAIYSRSGGSNGIGFAIPSEMVQVVANSARIGPTVRRPWVGARFQPVTADIADSLGLDRPRGALISDVFGRSPAAEAGLEVGDLIVAVDGQRIEDHNAFGYRIATKGLGGTVQLRVVRGDERIKVTLALQGAPEKPKRDVRALDDDSPFSGAEIANLSPALAEEIGYKFGHEGVVILQVKRGSIARRVGFRSGDVILEVNRRDVKSTRQLARLARRDSALWRISFLRKGQRRNVTLGR
ncbi:Do family serine endopeptidase [Coralliovum pocilloporae]|uniref:Do family serine endopeptidase n=1 Tax=Coralliovum pocilloporae TaxID=3066369 RepID=UPI003306DC9C